MTQLTNSFKPTITPRTNTLKRETKKAQRKTPPSRPATARLATAIATPSPLATIIEELPIPTPRRRTSTVTRKTKPPRPPPPNPQSLHTLKRKSNRFVTSGTGHESSTHMGGSRKNIKRKSLKKFNKRKSLKKSKKRKSKKR